MSKPSHECQSILREDEAGNLYCPHESHGGRAQMTKSKEGKWRGHNLEVFNERNERVASCTSWEAMNLIASAPELLEACKLAVSKLDSKSLIWVKQLEQAIAKAKEKV